jgi:hypothetical protein
MGNEFEAEVKRVKGKGKAGKAKATKQPSLHANKRTPSRASANRRASPLKTVGGTPIIQRTPEG